MRIWPGLERPTSKTAEYLMTNTPQSWQWRRALLVLVVLALLSAVLAELAVRAEDRIERGIPLTASPTYESELRIWRAGIWQGRPNGYFKKWRLNSLGFRSPEIDVVKHSGCTRIMILGASEIFGLYESEGHDFATTLGAELQGRGCFEIMNAAMAGLSLGSADIYWDMRLRDLHPDIVLLYPPPALTLLEYLEKGASVLSPPARSRKADEPGPVSTKFSSRLLDRLHDHIHPPASIKDWRTRRALEARIASHPSGWQKSDVPAAALQVFDIQFGALIDDIAKAGAEPILMTHATSLRKADVSSRPHDALWLESENPQVTAAAQVTFNEDANALTRELASKRGLRTVDLDAALTGCADCFVDPAHFTDKGAGQAAAAAADLIAPRRAVRN
jgi:hypothetical protein